MAGNRETEVAALEAQAKFWADFKTWPEEKQAQYFQEQHSRAEQFVGRVLTGLEAEGPVISPDRFDQIADQIEKAAPNHEGLYQGIRALGRHYVSSRVGTKGGQQG